MSGFPSILESINDLTKAHIDSLLERAKALKNKEPSRLPLTRKISVATSFLENSTRTKHSFAMAIKNLEGNYIDFNAETSSLKKGESLAQTLLTLNYQGIDICIIRTSESHILSQFKNHPPIKIINGGDGTNQHPTQALLDLFTLNEYFESIGQKPEGKTITIVGDCRHSRVTHSLIDLLPMYGYKVNIAGPEQFLPETELENIGIFENLEQAINESDALYLLRIQTERHASDNDTSSYYHELWGMSLEKLKKQNKLLPLFHPGPANIGVEVSQTLVDSNLWMAHHQVRNSVYMRMAIIEAMINNEATNIGAIYNDLSGEVSDQNS